jgi:large subunit ribosomal protein L10
MVTVTPVLAPSDRLKEPDGSPGQVDTPDTRPGSVERRASAQQRRLMLPNTWKEVSMENPRPEKVAVVEEVRDKLSASDAALFTEYRGLTVRDLAELRAAMREAGGEYRVYKNTLVRRAAAELELDLGAELVGPTAIAFVGQRPDGTPGDPVMVAKALAAFAKSHPHLVIKGGLLDTTVLDADGAKALATVAPREELLARFAGGLAAPMRNMAALWQAVPLKFAYGLQALIEAGGTAGASGAEAPAADATDETPADDTSADGAPADEAPTDDAAAAEAPAEESTADDAEDSAPADAADEAAPEEAPTEEAPADAADEAAPQTTDTADDAADAATEE